MYSEYYGVEENIAAVADGEEDVAGNAGENEDTGDEEIARQVPETLELSWRLHLDS